MQRTIANTVRVLAADAVEEAKSGHPGMPLGCAEIGTVLFSEVLNHDPAAPGWPNRDRFVLSAGHGSMFLYAFLHLTGYDLDMDDIKRFRTVGSITPGHPEYGVTPGAETTTGPLGQGFGNGVGMALAEAMLATRYNRPGHEIVDHYTYVLASDGDMMEGVASEAASLAAHLGLAKLIVIYDDNNISIEGDTALAFSESVSDRFRAYGWSVSEVDGHDAAAIGKALVDAKADGERPSLIAAKTRIGRHSLKEGSADSHGAALGEEAVAELKRTLGVPAEPFHVPSEVYDFFNQRRQEWQAQREAWQQRFEAWSQAYPELRRQWDAAHQLALPADLDEQVAASDAGDGVATRQASGKVLQRLAEAVPYLVGGSADLAPSTSTYLKEYPPVQRGEYGGRNFHFGVREHGMGTILNGISLHGGLRPFGATFLVFSDYMRPTIRLSALMGQPVVYVFTHDSIYLGEDGPTHQPVEHLEALRTIPNLRVIRPAASGEVCHAWAEALRHTSGPTALVLTRQKIPTLQGATGDPAGLVRGGYVVRSEGAGQPEANHRNNPGLVIIATGSEVWLSCAVAAQLEQEGHTVRVVSMPCREVFLQQDAAYRQDVLGPDQARRLIVEAGVAGGWYRLTRDGDRIHSLERFGESGPGNDVAAHLGFSVDAVTDDARRLLQDSPA